MNKEDVLRLIVIDDSSNHAETVSNMLRNAGQAVRATRVEDDEDLREALSSHSWDMILARPAIPYFSALDALSVVAQMEAEVPLIVLDEGADENRVIELLNAGARDAVALSNPSRLIHAILREAEDAKKRHLHRNCEQQLRESNRRAQSLVDSSRDAIAYVHEGMHIYANESYLQMFGYSDMAEIEGMPIMNMVSVADHNSFKEFLRGYIKGQGGTSELKVHGLRADGSESQITMEFSPASYEGEPCSQIIIRDQNISKELEQKLDSLSKQDLLTGVYNRQFFMDSLRSLAGKPGKKGAVLYIEPDKYKQIREEIGIAASDMLITDIASILNNQLRDQDIIARFESHVFTVILPDGNVAHAQTIAKSMLAAVEEHIFDTGGQSVALTCSIGIAAYSEAIRDAQDVLNRAEKAQGRAVEAGGNTFHLYNPAAEEMAAHEQASLWSGRLKQALRDNNFRLLYQPIVSLQGDGHENYEVLLRMLDESGKDILPSEFIPAAEQTGLMVAVDRWVLAHAVKTLAERHRGGKRTNFFVKLSAASLRDSKLLPWLRDLLKAARLEANTLTLEVSESVASNNLKLLKMLVEGLQQLRIRLALDHFGQAPNYANLLRHCNADFLKIDGGIVGEIARNQSAQAKLKEITAEAKQAGKSTIAEFVEDANTLALIWSSGVDYIQGYFLQEPSVELNYDFTQIG